MSLRKFLKAICIASVVTGVLTGCGSLQRKDFAGSESAPDSPVKAEEVSSSRVSENISKPYKSPLGDVPLTDNRMTRMWLKYFQGRGRKYMQTYLERSSRYLPMMKNVLREENLPEDLVYVALIESGFSPKAHSRANAVGYWQFIRSTGKSFGLRIDGYLDERRDPVLSTRAAAAYFKALYNLFGSWHLSLAAYNTGENRIKHRIMKYYTRDFWELARRRKIPRETRNYVPKFIAAAMIARDPAKYGFTNINYEPPLEYDALEATSQISLKKLAENLSVDYDELQRLNPKFRGDYVPNYEGVEMMIRVPVGKKDQAIAALGASAAKPPAHVHSDHYYYRVRRGDTLSEIAMNHRTTVGTLRRLNRLGRRSFIRIGQRLKVPDRGYSRRVSRASSVAINSDAAYHTVRRGENLTVIARRYGLSVSELKRLNRLGNRSLLQVGQKLRLKEESDSNASSLEGSTHVVSSGENLTLIAEKYGTNVRTLLRLNNLGRRSILYVGQKLTVPGGAREKFVQHRVRRGENLSLIAAKYGTSVRDIQQLNSLGRRSLLRVGQNLKIEVGKVHVVRRGETLSLISSKYNVPIHQIVEANSLRSKGLIAAGQSLVIPD